MKHACLVASAVLVLLATTARAVDLREVPRTIAKEPMYETNPKYGLLVFGPEAATRVWLVHDGATLYADLNGNGDLTDPAERFAADESYHANDGTFRFKVGEIHEGDRLHKSLSVYTMNLQHLAQREPRVRDALVKHPKSRFYGMEIELQMPGRRGTGLGGRVEHLVSPIDAHGLLVFADTPAEAPIIHFGGLWEITLFGTSTLTVGRQKEVYLGLGTPGLGPGTTAFAAYQNLVPDGLFPKLEITFPGETETTVEYVLQQRCCTVNFHDRVPVPDDVSPGEATVNITFDDWIGGFVAPSTHRVQVAKSKFNVVLEPVSPRLKSSLMHPARDGVLYGIRFSPDGKQLIAGDYPGGIVQLWDVATGEQLRTISHGAGRVRSSSFFHVTPGWKSLYMPRWNRKMTRVERDGKRLLRWECDGDIREWDLTSGEQVRQLQQTPPRSIIQMTLSPDGRFFLTGEELAGEYERQPPRRVSLWDAETGTARDLLETFNPYGLFSPDSSVVAVTAMDRHTTAVHLFDTSSGKETLTIPIEGEFAQAHLMAFSLDGSVLCAHYRVYPVEDDWKTFQASLRFWDTRSGEIVSTINAEEGERFYAQAAFSPGGRVFAMPNVGSDRAKVHLVDSVRGEITRTVDLSTKTFVREPAFSPDGQWLAVATQVFPEGNTQDLTAQDVAQPRIHLVDVATGEIRETIIAPQGFPTSLAFSPDGRTLASGGDGRVLLWDLSVPPGQLAARKAGE